MRHPDLDLILGELSTELKALYRDRFVGHWLYGSQARGDASPESDIDVLLVLTRLERPALEIDRYAGILADLNLRHGVLLSVIPVEQSQLLGARGPFLRNPRAEGIAAFAKRQQADYLPDSGFLAADVSPLLEEIGQFRAAALTWLAVEQTPQSSSTTVKE